MSEVARNLEFINSVVCPFAKVALLGCTDPDALQRLKLAYPEAFPSEPIGIRMTWSYIRERWKQYVSNHADLYDESDAEDLDKMLAYWLLAFDATEQKDWVLKFGLDWDNGKPVVFNGGPTIPPDIVLQLWDLKSLDMPIIVTYKGAQWLVGSIADEGVLYELKGIHRFTTHEDWGRNTLSMVPLASIDMTK